MGNLVVSLCCKNLCFGNNRNIFNENKIVIKRESVNFSAAVRNKAYGDPVFTVS